MVFPRQEYWSGLSFSSPGDLSEPRVEPASFASPALAGGFFTSEPPGKFTHGVSANIIMETAEKVIKLLNGNIYEKIKRMNIRTHIAVSLCFTPETSIS